MQAKNILSATLGCKCPRCRTGNLFTFPLYRISKFHLTNKNCPVCNFQFEIEPGFFFGAMFISYAILVATLVTTTLVLFYLFNDPHVLVYVVTVPSIIFLLLPLIFRLSRSIYLHLASGVNYDENYVK